jgi:hypothetical protein
MQKNVKIKELEATHKETEGIVSKEFAPIIEPVTKISDEIKKKLTEIKLA